MPNIVPLFLIKFARVRTINALHLSTKYIHPSSRASKIGASWTRKTFVSWHHHFYGVGKTLVTYAAFGIWRVWSRAGGMVHLRAARWYILWDVSITCWRVESVAFRVEWDTYLNPGMTMSSTTVTSHNVKNMVRRKSTRLSAMFWSTTLRLQQLRRESTCSCTRLPLNPYQWSFFISLFAENHSSWKDRMGDELHEKKIRLLITRGSKTIICGIDVIWNVYLWCGQIDMGTFLENCHIYK